LEATLERKRNLAGLLTGHKSEMMAKISELQRDLDDSEQRFNVLVENAPVGIVISAFDGRIGYVNQTLVNLHGYETKEEFIESPVETRYRDVRDRDRWVSAAWDRGSVEGFEVETKRKDGSLFWSSISACTRKKESGEQELVAFVRDVTEQKKAEEAVRRSEQRYCSLFAHMHEGFAYCRMIFDDGRPVDFEYVEVNERFQQLTGLGNPAGKRVSELIPGIQHSNPELFDIYGRVASGGPPEKFETYLEGLNKAFSVSLYSHEDQHFIAVFDVVHQAKQAPVLGRNDHWRD
jgi:PAS domain S-box-containing protein